MESTVERGGSTRRYQSLLDYIESLQRIVGDLNEIAANLEENPILHKERDEIVMAKEYVEIPLHNFMRLKGLRR